MKKLLALTVSAAGAVLTIWAGSVALSGTGQYIYGYHALYPGLVGVALLSGGLILWSQD